MPHMLVEYSDNLEFDIQTLFARLADAMLATKVVRVKGFRFRAMAYSDYLVADGKANNAFVHLGLRIREGRPQERKEALAQACLSVLEEFFAQDIAAQRIALSVDIQELYNGTSLNSNHIPSNE